MPTTNFMDFKTLADIQGHFDIALDLLLKKENFGHGEWPYKLYQREASCQYEKLGKQCGQPHQKDYVVSCTDGSVVLRPMPNCPMCRRKTDPSPNRHKPTIGNGSRGVRLGQLHLGNWVNSTSAPTT